MRPNTDSVQALPKSPTGSQTLLRGLDLIEAVMDGPRGLADLAAELDLTRSTTHRLATALVERRYLSFVPRLGYQFGPKLLELGFRAHQQTDLVRLARPLLEELAASAGDTVHLGVLDHDRVLCIAKIPGRRRVEINSRVGDSHCVTSTGLGKALLLDSSAEEWKRMFLVDHDSGAPPIDFDLWVRRMRGYVAAGRAFDMEENVDRIRCVAAPIRDAGGRIVAAFSVTSAAHYMSDARMETLSRDVLETAAEISASMGWFGTPSPRA